MSAEHERSTKMVRFDQLSMTMTEALAEHSASRQLALADDMPAWLTHSVNRPSTSILGKLFGAGATEEDSEQDVLVVLHPTHMLVVTAGENQGTTALSVPLTQASVRVGGALEDSFSAVEDSGVTIGGFPGDDGQLDTFYIGLGPEPAGAECAEAIRAAITDAKNP